MTLEKIPIKIRTTEMTGAMEATSVAATGAIQTNRHAHNRAGDLVGIKAAAVKAATKVVVVDTKAAAAVVAVVMEADNKAAVRAAADTKAKAAGAADADTKVAEATAVADKASKVDTNSVTNANRVVDINKVAAAEGTAAVDLTPEADTNRVARAAGISRVDINKIGLNKAATNSKADAADSVAIGVMIAETVVTANAMNGYGFPSRTSSKKITSFFWSTNPRASRHAKASPPRLWTWSKNFQVHASA